MENNTNGTKIIFAKNMQKLNINLIISTDIDHNVNIKKIIDINTYIYDTNIECGNGKAVISGKVGAKILYLDTDNITNTISSSQTFNETYTNSTITSDCYLNFSDYNISHNVLSTEGVLKINTEIVFNPIAYINLPLNVNSNFDNMIVKKSEINTNTINKIINSNFDYTANFETKDNISKILCFNTQYNNLNLICNENYVIVEGKLFATLIYETLENEETKIKQISDCFNVKTDVNIEGLTSDCLLDISFSIDKSKENIVIEKEEDGNLIIATNKINLYGVSTKSITIETVDDLYSTENELEINFTKREYTKEIANKLTSETITNEIILNSDEMAIDEVVSNLEIKSETTNTYVKDGFLFLEGIISSNLVYIDENGDYQVKICEVPFVINTKLTYDKLDCTHTNINITDCKTKIKRGTIIELEYQLCINICVYIQTYKDIVNNISLGKNLDFSNYDYQIYLTKPNENMWELCKRIKTTPENINKYNKNLPIEFTGKEKIIIKR